MHIVESGIACTTQKLIWEERPNRRRAENRNRVGRVTLQAIRHIRQNQLVNMKICLLQSIRSLKMEETTSRGEMIRLRKDRKKNPWAIIHKGRKMGNVILEICRRGNRK